MAIIITFNNGGGSDSQASGSGPTTAIFGTAASYTGNVVSLDGSPDLSAFDSTSWVLWLQTSSGRQFFDLSAANNSAKTVTTVNAPAGTATGLTWGIGGKRKTLDNANSRNLFSNDAKPGWTIQLEDDQPALTSALNFAASGSTSGWIFFQGNSTTTRRLLTSATNNTSLITAGATNWMIKNLNFQSTAATKTSSYGISASASSGGILWVENCVFGDATNQLQNAINRSGSTQFSIVYIINCEIKNCIGYGLDNGGGSASTIVVLDTWIHNNGGTAGLFLQFGIAYINIIENNLINNNTGVGILVNNPGTSQENYLYIKNNTINNNSSDGIQIQQASNMNGAIIINNQITQNGGWGINYTSTAGDLIKGLIDYNNYGTSGTSNTSGAVTGFTIGANSLTANPGFTNTASNDFSLSSSSTSRASGYPSSSQNIGANNTSTKTYIDIGAAQHPDSPNTYVVNKIINNNHYEEQEI